MTEDALIALAQDALAQAGLAGLCREGRIELALGRLAEAAPERPRVELLALVESLDDEL